MPETANPAHIPAFLGGDERSVVGWCQHCERHFMMHQNSGWMGGWAGGGMWVWTVIGVVVVVLLVVVISKLSRK
jgi:uncharacterized membrane protein